MNISPICLRHPRSKPIDRISWKSCGGCSFEMRWELPYGTASCWSGTVSFLGSFRVFFPVELPNYSFLLIWSYYPRMELAHSTPYWCISSTACVLCVLMMFIKVSLLPFGHLTNVQHDDPVASVRIFVFLKNDIAVPLHSDSSYWKRGSAAGILYVSCHVLSSLMLQHYRPLCVLLLESLCAVL